MSGFISMFVFYVINFLEVSLYYMILKINKTFEKKGIMVVAMWMYSGI